MKRFTRYFEGHHVAEALTLILCFTTLVLSVGLARSLKHTGGAVHPSRIVFEKVRPTYSPLAVFYGYEDPAVSKIWADVSNGKLYEIQSNGDFKLLKTHKLGDLIK